MKKNYFMLFWVVICLFSLHQISYGQLSFNSTPVTTATVSVPYTYSSFAADGTSNAPTMTCPTKPAWLNFAASGSTSMVTFGPAITQPGGIAGDSDGNTYVVSLNGSYIYKIAPDGTANTTWAAVDIGYIYAMNVDNGYLYVSYYANNVTGTSCIKKISLSNPAAGQTMVYNEVSNNRLLSLVFRGGFIYCANYGMGKIIKINPTNGTAVDYVAISNPFGLGFDASGLLYIASYGLGSVSTYDGVTLTSKVSSLSNPSDVKIDANGNIYVSLSGGGIIKYNSTFTTNNVLVPLGGSNSIWGMNLSPTGSLVFGLYSQNTCARIGTGAVLSGTPSSADIGPHNVTITATSSTETVSQNFVVTVQGPPTITNFPDLTGAVGTDLTITAPTSNSAGAFTYTSSNTSVATISGSTVTPLAAGSTTITATQASSGNYMQGTITCTLTVSSCTPVTITSQPTAQTSCVGSTASFTVAATGTGLSYQWKKGATNITNATAATLSLTNVSSADAANYSCVVTGTCSTVTSSAVALSMDATLPTITAPANVNTTTNTACTATGVALGTPTTADNCSVASVTNDAPTAFPIGLTTVTWTVTDSAGNTATETQNVTVVDNTSPTITSPADVNATTNTGCSATSVVLGTPITADNCSVTSVTNDAPAIFPLGETIVTWIVNDANENYEISTQKVTVTDNVNPTITAPADVTGTVNSSCVASAIVLGTPVTADNCSVATVTNDAPATFPFGDTTVTWTVTDGSGNTATATQLVSVGDVIYPVVRTKNTIAYLNSFGQATVTPVMIDNGTTDNCTFSLMVSPNNFVAGNIGINNVILIATDASGNQTIRPAIVTIVDNLPPTITAPSAVSAIANASCGATGVVLGTPITSDNGYIDTPAVNNAPATFPVGATTVTWTITDRSGNSATATQIVTVTDTQNPTIATLTPISVNADAGFCTYASSQLTAPTTTDNCSVTATASPASLVLGSNTVTWTATDGSGNTATSTQTVTVVDVQNPTITIAAVIVSANASCNATSVNLGTPTTTDNCSVDGTSNDAPATFPLGNTTVTWTVTDGSGNTATTTQIVTVVDNQKPTVETLTDISVNADTSVCTYASSQLTAPTAADNCSVASVVASPVSLVLGSNTVTWTATDGNGNTETSIQNVTVIDTQNPTIVTLDPISVNADSGVCTYASSQLTRPAALDNCSVASVLASPASLVSGPNTVTWTATDGSGLTATSTQTVTVVDAQNPVVITQNLTIQLDASGSATITADQINNGSTDNCGIASISLDKTTFSCTDIARGPVPLTGTPVGSVPQVVTVFGGAYNPNTNEFWYPNYGGPTTIRTYDALHNYITSFASPVETIMQLWIDKSSADYYTANFWGRNINRVSGGSIVWTYTMGGSSSAAAAVTTNDTYVFAMEFETNTIVVLNKATGVFVKNITLPGVFRTYGGLVYANGLLYVTGYDQDSITTVPLTQQAIHGFDATTGAYVGSFATAVEPYITSFDGETIWISDQSNTIHGYKISNGNAYNGSAGGSGSTVTLTVTDGSGNSSSATATVTVEDNVLPIAVAQALTAQLDASGNATITAAQIDNGSSDACGIKSLSVAPSSFTCANKGDNTVTLTVTDNNDNVSTTTAIVTIEDVLNPTITTASAINVNADSGVCTYASSQLTAPSAADNCSVATVVASPASLALGSNTVTWTVTDGGGLTATSTQIVTVVDSQNPTINTLAAINVNADASVCTYASSQLTAPTAADNCSVATVVASPASLALGANTVTWTVTDGAGLTATSTQTVTVVDAQIPTIVTLNPINVNADSSVCTYASSQLTAPTAADNCSVATVVASPASLVLGANTVTWTVTDGAGLTETSIQTVTVVDAQNPTIATLGAISVNADSGVCTYASSQLTAPNAADNCSVATVLASPASLLLGANTVTWTVTDGAGLTATSTQTVTVVDIQNPSISILDVVVSANASCNATGVDLGTPTSIDNCSVASVTNNAPATFPLGDTTVTWTITDGSGNTATNTQIVTVEDTTLPTITAPAAVTGNVNSSCGANGVVIGNAITADNCSVASVTNDAPAIFPLGETTVTWTVTDGSGNIATATQLVTMGDTIFPVVRAKNAIVYLNSVGQAIILPSMIDNGTTDNCEFTLTVSPNNLVCANVGLNNVLLIATDASGNQSFKPATITLVDNLPPTITAPSSVSVNANASCNATGIVLGSPLTADNCNVDTVVNNAPANFPIGITTVTWTVTDRSGNTATANQTVTVTEAVLPIALTKDIVVMLDASGNATITAAEIDNGSSDNCGISTMTLSQYTFTISDVGIQTITLTVTDNSGNVSTATAQVTIDGSLNTTVPKSNTFLIYPIPFDSQINITLPDSYTEDVIYIQVYDLTGRAVYNQKHAVENNNVTINDLKGFSDGRYYINLLDGNQNVIQSKHILKKSEY